MTRAVEPCEELEECSFFLRAQAKPDLVECWKRLFCESRAKSAFCERRRRFAGGESVPVNLAPTGQLIEQD